MVRWPNGIKSNYRFGYDGKYDVILCDHLDETVVKTLGTDRQTNKGSEPDSQEKNELLVKVGKNTSTNQDTEEVSEELDNNNSLGNLSSWEWKNKDGNWVSFPYSEKVKIQKAYNRNIKGTVLVRIDEDLYRVVLSKMIQINISSRESQEIRRLS